MSEQELAKRFVDLHDQWHQMMEVGRHEVAESQARLHQWQQNPNETTYEALLQACERRDRASQRFHELHAAWVDLLEHSQASR